MKTCDNHKDAPATKIFGVGSRFFKGCEQCSKSLEKKRGVFELTTLTPEKHGQHLPEGPVSRETFEAVIESLTKRGLVR